MNEKWIRIKFEVNIEYINIFVIDSGKGIPIEIQNKIMQPFYTTKGVGKGTGLGLSISKSIIESHKGKLSYDGALGNTCFVINLPLRQ